MIGIIESILGRLGGSAFAAGVESLIRKFSPVKIVGQKVPRNFFDYFGPGVSKEFVVSKVGAPHRQIESLWLYQFSDALAQFDFRDGSGAKSVALALVNDSPKVGFDLPLIGASLGKLTFDSFAGEKEGEFSYRSSLRTWELLYSRKFPPQWASNYYTFGALSLLAPGVFRESSFDTKIAEHDPHAAAQGVLVNWLGISDTSEELWFDWSIAFPASA